MMPGWAMVGAGCGWATPWPPLLTCDVLALEGRRGVGTSTGWPRLGIGIPPVGCVDGFVSFIGKVVTIGIDCSRGLFFCVESGRVVEGSATVVTGGSWRSWGGAGA